MFSKTFIFASFLAFASCNIGGERPGRGGSPDRPGQQECFTDGTGDDCSSTDFSCISVTYQDTSEVCFDVSCITGGILESLQWSVSNSDGSCERCSTRNTLTRVQEFCVPYSALSFGTNVCSNDICVVLEDKEFQNAEFNDNIQSSCFTNDRQLCKMCDIKLTVNIPDDVPCGDANVCKTTGFEATCVSGVCENSMNVDCSSLDDDCGTGVCENPVGCVFEPVSDNTPCGPANLCKETGFENVCVSAVCEATNDLDCSSLDDVCVVGVCDLTDGCIAEPANEGNVCTPDVACQANNDAQCIDGICTCPDCTQTFLDIVMVLDESSSVGSANFELTKDFVESFLNGFTSNSFTTIIEFATSASQTIPWNDAITVASNIDTTVTFSSGTTNTRQATILAKQAIEQGTFNTNNRADIVIYVTDGVPCCSSNRQVCTSDGLPFVNDLKSVADAIYIVAVGDFNVNTISCLVDNEATDIFDVSNFTQLQNIVNTLRDTVCTF